MFHLDRAGSLLGLPKIVLKLELQPAFWQTAERLGQPNRHVRGNPRMTVEQRRERATCDAETLGGGRDRQAQRIEA